MWMAGHIRRKRIGDNDEDERRIGTHRLCDAEGYLADELPVGGEGRASRRRHNVREKSLKEIHDAMTSIRYFGSYSPICLAGQDKAFRKKYLDGIGMSMFQPKDAREVFKNEEDYLR